MIRLILATCGAMAYGLSLFVFVPLAVATLVSAHVVSAGLDWPAAWTVAAAFIAWRVSVSAHRAGRDAARPPVPQAADVPHSHADRLGRVLALLADERGLTNEGLAEKADLPVEAVDAALSDASQLDDELKGQVLLGLWRAEPMSMPRADAKRLLDAGLSGAVLSASVESHNKESANGR
jgi:hypothetical protein